MHCKASGFGKGKRYYIREGFWPAKTVNSILIRNEKGSYMYKYHLLWSGLLLRHDMERDFYATDTVLCTGDGRDATVEAVQAPGLPPWVVVRRAMTGPSVAHWVLSASGL